MAAAFSKKIKEHEEKYAMVPEMERTRSKSVTQERASFFALTKEEQAGTAPEEQKAAGGTAARARLPDPTDVLMHPLKKNKHR